MKKYTLSIIIILIFCHVLFSQYAKVNLTNVRIRENPTIKSKIIAYVTDTDIVKILNKSNKIDTIIIRNKKITDNWYKVETLAGIGGWIFGGTLNKNHIKKNPVYKTPEIIGIGHARLWRRSNNFSPKNKTWSLPPWEKIEIIQASYYLNEPIINSKISVVSKEGFIPFFNTKVIRKRKRNDCERCDIWWEIDIKQIIHTAWYNIRGSINRVSEYPSDFILFYPTLKYAKVISVKNINDKYLPNGIFKQNITSSIDLTGNNKPDFIEYKFYCKDPKNSNKKSWDLICTHYYVKKKNKWNIITSFYLL